MKFLSYHPQASIGYYVRYFAEDLFDEYDLHDSYDIDHFIDTVLKFVPKRRLHGLNNNVAAACIYAVSGNWKNFERPEDIPHIKQKQIVYICGVSFTTINRILKEIRQPKYSYRIPLKPKE